jgi:hypothetical protein
MALAGKRALWTAYVGGGNYLYTDLNTATAGARRISYVAELDTGVWDTGEGWFTALAGDADTLMEGWAVYELEDSDACIELGACVWQLTGGAVDLVVGAGEQTLPLPRPAALAVSGDRVAVAPLDSADQTREGEPVVGAAKDGPVEVDNARSGDVIASFNPAGTVKKLALTKTRAASLAVLAGGGRQIEVHSATTGALQRSLAVSRLARELDMAGRLVVYRVDKAIRVLNVETGAVRTAAHIKGKPVNGLSIEDHRIVWAENRNGHGLVRTLVLP